MLPKCRNPVLLLCCNYLIGLGDLIYWLVWAIWFIDWFGRLIYWLVWAIWFIDWFGPCAGVPGKPGVPVIEDVDENSVLLSWYNALDDGGSKVLGYMVESREKGTNTWKPLNEEFLCRETKFRGYFSLISLFLINVTQLSFACSASTI